MNFLKNLYKQENGATSVLVIFMMIVLVTLGAFTISSANVNYRLGESAKVWNTEYYKLEDMGEEYVMNVDMVLSKAVSDSISYIMDESYKNPTHTNISNELQTEIYIKFSENNSQDAVDFAFRQVYMYYALEGLKELGSTYESNIVTPTQDGNIISKITTEVNFVSTVDEEKNLKISLEIRPLDGYVLNYENDETVIYQENDVRKYDIIEWNQWNVPIEIEETVNIWNK